MNNINIITEFLSLVIAILNYRWLRNSFWWLFIPFLGATLVIETLASFVWTHANGWLYNIYVLLQFPFTSFFFYRVTGINKLKTTIKLTAFAFLLFCIYMYLFQSSFIEFNLWIFTLDCFLTVLYAIFFLFYCINENDITKIAAQRPALSVTIGIVIFFSIVSILFNTYKFIRANELKLFGIYLDNIVPQLLSIIMYGCFSYAFIVWKQTPAK